METASGDDTSWEVDSRGGVSGDWALVGAGRGLPGAGVQGERLGSPELATDGEEVEGGGLGETGEDFADGVVGLRRLRAT